jgi:four helix bundle protein
MVSGAGERMGASDAKFPLDEFELYGVAREFRRNVYRLIRQLPPAERYCLDPQMRKAIVSVTNNIAEGHGRWHYRENIQFCRIARGSVEEIIDDLNVCSDESYGDQQLVAKLRGDAYALIARVNGYIAYLRKSRQGET